jgi:asparagine synthase (glutamine-hydrolysing)
MCGIVGIFNIQGGPVDLVTLGKAVTAVKHRGPNDEGYAFINTVEGTFRTAGGKDTPDAVRASKYTYSPVSEIDSFDARSGGYNLAFGHRRLSIVDLSPAGHQPMCNSDGTIWIIYNGEIYNYIELREELKSKGHSFTTQSDTEVILQAYQEWGYDCQYKFNGMWAFAIWDSRRHELFCSRDRFGVKPFYYYWDGTNLAFASEIKALLQCSFVKTSPDDEAIYQYLVLGRSEGKADTFFTNIKQLEPGHFLTVSENGLKEERYYSLYYTKEAGIFDEKALQGYADEFLDLFKDAVRIRLRSDVPVGSCLSGGLDSSAIVCTINRFLGSEGYGREVIGERQKTFSACYELSAYDERQFIQEVVNSTKVDAHHIFPSGEKLWAEMDNLVWHQEEPFGSTSIYAQWNVMRLARDNGVPVLLDGQGADEMLAGYHSYFNAYLTQLLYEGQFGSFWRESNAVRRMTKNPVYSSFAFLLPVYNALPANMRSLLRDRIVKGSMLKLQDTGLIDGAFLQKHAREDQSMAETNLQTALWRSEIEYGLRELLRYEDKNSMAFSIETRTPFIDYRLVEYVFSLPACYKIHDGWTKYLLRASTEGLLPEKIRWRRDKMGFPTPETTWMRGNADKIREVFAGKSFRASGYLDQKWILMSLDKLLGIESAEGLSALWKPLNLELWLRRMFP